MTIGYSWEGLWWQEVIDPASVIGDPPQWLYQPAMLIAFLLSLYQWILSKNKVWLLCSLMIFVSIGSIPYLHYRNEAFGAPARDGLLIYWGLPFLWSSIMLVAASICSIIVSKKDRYVLFIAYAVMLVNILIRLRPFRPTSEIYSLIGPWGAGVIFAGFFCVILCAKKSLCTRYAATLAVLHGLVLYGISGLFGIGTFLYADISTDVLWKMFFGGFHHPPALLAAVAMVLSAFIYDYWQRPVVVGVVYASVLYGMANIWLTEEAKMAVMEQCIAVISCAVCAWVLFRIQKYAQKGIVEI